MNKGMIVSGIIGILCLALPGIAADADASADHNALRLLRDRVESSMNAGDLQGLRTCFAKDFTFITSDQKVLTSWADVAAYWDGMFKSDKSPVKALSTKITAEILTQFSGPDTGYCHGTSRDVYTLQNGRKIAIENTWSAVVVKEPDGWKIRAVHVAVNFLDNPVLAVREMSWFGKLCVALRLNKLPGEVEE